MSENKKDDVVKDIETVTIGDVVYNKDEVTPSAYFDYVKGLKEKLNNEEYDLIIDTTIKMLKKAELTKQTEMAYKLTEELKLALRELDAAKAGFDIYVSRKEVEKYITDVESKSIKIIELSKYEREIPDDVIDKISKANEIFDELYIVFTDYTKKETKKVAKHRRDKDPILFGAFKEKAESDSTRTFVSDRLFFIADWVEEKCDLTLEEICRDIKDKSDKSIIYKVNAPDTEKDAKAILDSFTKETLDDTKLEPVSLDEEDELLKDESIFTIIKREVVKKVRASKKSTKKDDDKDKKPAKRGRRKKSEE